MIIYCGKILNLIFLCISKLVWWRMAKKSGIKMNLIMRIYSLLYKKNATLFEISKASFVGFGGKNAIWQCD